ncbi:MAG: ATP-binding protein, partial [Bacteroidota bacterium]
VIPLYLNYRRKYFATKVYTVLACVVGISTVHLLHGWNIRLEPTYLMMILLCSFFFKRNLAIIMSTFVAVMFIAVAISLQYITPPRADSILPTVPIAYFIFSVISCIVLITKVLMENEKVNLITSSQNETLAKKNKQLEKFTYIASHDLKTPIRNVTSFAMLVDRDLKRKKYEGIPDHVAYIKSSALQMSALVEDILQISTLDYADQEVRTMTNLTHIAQQVVGTLKNELSAPSAKIKIENLPDYHCNPSEFYLVFQNLIQNSIKYNENKIQRVKIWSEEVGNEIQIHVQDNGIGIEEAYFEQIFEFFKRLHSSNEYEGTGLGLGLCKRIIESYQGRISLISTPGEGSTFTIHLPK